MAESSARCHFLKSLAVGNFVPNVVGDLLVLIDLVDWDEGQDVLGGHNPLLQSPVVLHPRHHQQQQVHNANTHQHPQILHLVAFHVLFFTLFDHSRQLSPVLLHAELVLFYPQKILLIRRRVCFNGQEPEVLLQDFQIP